jgi:acyl phosphate:glycerol-3-phosphate acyltransferase
LIGAIPTGWIVANFAGIDDITKQGSGNIGATNVGRILGLKYFFFVLLLDSAKAFLYVTWLASFCSEGIVLLSALSVLTGNGISIFLQGKGGKGVATTIGILFALNPLILYCVFFVWLFSAILIKNMGMACVSAFLALPVISYLIPHSTDFLCTILFITCWGLWRHESNIRRFFSLDKASA